MNGPIGQRTVKAQDFADFAQRVFVALGASIENANIVAKHLVEASLRGVDSHGVSRIPVYAGGVLAGDIDPKAKPMLVKERNSRALIDGNKSFGQVSASFAVELAISKAKENGTSSVGVRNLNHVGMLSYYGLMLAKSELIGKIFTNGFPRVAPWGGRNRLLGTNPLCFAFPVKGEQPLTIDISTAVAAAFKIVIAAKEGKSIPKGWAIDPQGTETTDPKAALDGAILPMAGHKGYGLGLSVEILSSILTGSAANVHIKPIPYTQGGLYIEAEDIGIFRDADDYYRDLGELIGLIRSSPVAQGFKAIYLPGEPETKEKARRAADGIPVSNTMWNDLVKVASEHSVKMPPSDEGSPSAS